LTICREWSLVKHGEGEFHAKLLLCRSWSCEYCRPLRRSQLLAKCAAGEPTRLLTLTVNPAVGADQGERLLLLANAWRIIVKRLRRERGQGTVEYLAVVEYTKAGEPHLHILLRSKYVPQALLSSWMAELIDAPIVDIRAIKNQKEVIRYVAKYVTKELEANAGRKRYWTSGSWEPRREAPSSDAQILQARWTVERRGLVDICREYTYEGYVCRSEGLNAVVGWLLVGERSGFLGLELATSND